MELYIGESTQTILNYVLNHKQNLKNPIICDGATATQSQLYTAHIIINFHLFIQKQLQTSQPLAILPKNLLLHNPYVIIISNKPNNHLSLKTHSTINAQKLENIYQELTQKSQTVMHISSSLTTTIKENNNIIFCSFIRHGSTAGNLYRRYIGSTDEPLCKEGIHTLQTLKKQHTYPSTDLLYVSPMHRCQETAALLYPTKNYILCDLLKECNFGEFENKNPKELQNNAHYQRWINSHGSLPFPNGEDPNAFTQRCIQGFFKCICQVISSSTTPPSLWTTFIVHGGTIMSILSRLSSSPKDFFSFKVNNGGGYLCAYNIDTQALTILDTL